MELHIKRIYNNLTWITWVPCTIHNRSVLIFILNKMLSILGCEINLLFGCLDLWRRVPFIRNWSWVFNCTSTVGMLSFSFLYLNASSSPAESLRAHVGWDKVVLAHSSWPAQEVCQTMGHAGSCVACPFLCCYAAFWKEKKVSFQVSFQSIHPACNKTSGGDATP